MLAFPRLASRVGYIDNFITVLLTFSSQKKFYLFGLIFTEKKEEHKMRHN